jgi:2-keto-4-pentenoate hydratase/2-oxohepta-3-ene-1,7-dioic acid hydratase in catechol pathway
MRLLLFDDYRLGVLRNDLVVDVTDAVSSIPHTFPQDLMMGLIERFDEFRGRLESAAGAGNGRPLADVRVRPPLPQPRTIVCMAVNFNDGMFPIPPINAFLKSPQAIIGDGDTMVLPDVPATIFEGEAEMAVVIGRRATNVSADRAMDHVFGYTNFIDGSARGLNQREVFYQMKSRDTFAPIGPFIVTADEIADPYNLQTRLWNNGVLMQDFSTGDMVNNISRSIEWVSSIHTLVPGDIISMGTNHRGLNPFMDGDQVEMETEGLGRLHIRIRDDLKRVWARETRGQRKDAGQEGTTPQLEGKYTPASV